jgi:hypothetical protein
MTLAEATGTSSRKYERRHPSFYGTISPTGRGSKHHNFQGRRFCHNRRSHFGDPSRTTFTPFGLPWVFGEEYRTFVRPSAVENKNPTPTRSIWRTPSGHSLYEHFKSIRQPFHPDNFPSEAGPSS